MTKVKTTMKKLFILTVLTLVATAAFAQFNKENNFGVNTLKFEVRTDFDYYSQNDSSYSGFTGRYLNFIMKGDINEHLYYAYRQRLNKTQTMANFFDATDFLYIGWRINDNFALTAGKEVVVMGGIEYDLAPIDVYFHSRSWELNCYQFGANLQFTTNDEKNIFTLQFTNSPFGIGYQSGLYNYSFHWRANYKHFGPVCSINMFEHKKGDFLNVIALGTTYKFGPIDGHFDFLHRASTAQSEFLGHDYTFIAQLGVNLCKDKLHLYVKGGYDFNDAQPSDTPIDIIYDPYVMPGTDMKTYGGGLEFYPVNGSKNLRIHAFFAVNDTKDEKILYQGNVGLTWRLNFIDK